MTEADLVARLRSIASDVPGLAKEAADEIERLRQEVTILRAELEGKIDPDVARAVFAMDDTPKETKP